MNDKIGSAKKGSGVVVMDKSEYVSLLKESSISDETKFIPVSLERPKTKGRPPKHCHHCFSSKGERTVLHREKNPTETHCRLTDPKGL